MARRTSRKKTTRRTSRALRRNSRGHIHVRRRSIRRTSLRRNSSTREKVIGGLRVVVKQAAPSKTAAHFPGYYATIYGRDGTSLPGPTSRTAAGAFEATRRRLARAGNLLAKSEQRALKRNSRRKWRPAPPQSWVSPIEDERPMGVPTLHPADQGPNREGLTWDEWRAAARTGGLTTAKLLAAWRAGEDPIEYRDLRRNPRPSNSRSKSTSKRRRRRSRGRR